MRQSNQKSRSRGRGRKHQNPMSKNFESNGPDVKIRGNASHIAEKYTTLARDAQSNGDTVMAENYLQHAEHYNRIVAAAQLQNQQRAEEAAANGANNKGPQPNGDADGTDATPAQNGEEHAEASAPQDISSEVEAGEGENANGGQKSKRNGRSRSKPKAELEASDDVETSPETETVSAEVISDDASKLPGSIIGEVPAEEA